MNNKIKAVKTAANSFISTVGENEAISAQYKVITFGGRGGKNDTAAWLKTNGWVAANSAVTAVDGIQIGGNVGTNYEAGITLATSELGKNARSGAQKVVVFFSDGEPTFRSTYDNGYGNGDNDNNGKNLEAAVNAAKKLTCDYFYCIGTGTAKLKNLQTLANAANATTKGAQTTSDVDKLTKIFKDIAAQITTFLCTDVTVIDVLSENVQMVMGSDNKPKKLVVTVKNKSGATVGTPDGITANYYADQKKIVMDFPDDYELDPEYTYIVTANIEATETAYQHVREHGGTYPNTGEKGTGKTSEGKGGVFTNTKAEVAYTYNDVGTTESYNNPVIQLKPAKLIVKKTITGLTEEKINSALKNNLTFDITYTYPTGKQTTVTETKKLSDFTKNADDTYTYTSGDIWSMGATYEVTEKMFDVADYDCVATPDKATGSIPKYSTATATFTNTYTKATQDLTITKEILVDGNKYEGAEFNDAEYTFTVSSDKLSEDQTVTVKGAGSVTIEGLPVGSYTITETNRTNEPAKYEFKETDRPQEITLSKENHAVTITNKYETKKYKVYVRKELDGNMYNSSDKFDFNVTGKTETLQLGKDETSSAYEVTYGDSFTVKETNDKGYTSTTAKAYKATVSNGTVSAGTEVNGTYKDDDKSYTLSNITEDIIIVYTNTKQITPPNGIITTIAPYAIMVVLAAGAGVYFVYSRRRRNH